MKALHGVNPATLDRSHWMFQNCELWLKSLPDLMGGTTWYDLSGKSRNATLVNGPTWGSGSRGPQLGFDGTDDYATTWQTDSFGITTAFSVAFWINPITATNGRIVIKDPGEGISNRFFYLAHRTSGKLFSTVFRKDAMEHTSSTIAATVASAANGVWTHGVFVYCSTVGSRFYIAGKLDSTETTKPAITANNGWPVTIGGVESLDSQINSQLDDIRIYSRALSAAEIAEIYQDSYSQRYEALRGTDIDDDTEAAALLRRQLLMEAY